MPRHRDKGREAERLSWDDFQIISVAGSRSWPFCQPGCSRDTPQASSSPFCRMLRLPPQRLLFRVRCGDAWQGQEFAALGRVGFSHLCQKVSPWTLKDGCLMVVVNGFSCLLSMYLAKVRNSAFGSGFDPEGSAPWNSVQPRSTFGCERENLPDGSFLFSV